MNTSPQHEAEREIDDRTALATAPEPEAAQAPEAHPEPEAHSADESEPPPARRGWSVFGSILRSTVITVAAVLGAVTIVVVAICLITGVRPAIVVSGSMSPTIPTGSMTFAREIPVSQVQVDDIVTVERVIGNGLVTHRVIGIEEGESGTELVLQGDANDTPDPAPYPVRTAGEVVFHVPGLGSVAAVIRTPLGLTSVALLVAAFVIFGFMPPRERGEKSRK